MKNGLSFSSSRVFSPDHKIKKAKITNSLSLSLSTLTDVPTAIPTSTLISSLCESQLGKKRRKNKQKIRPDIFGNQTARPEPARKSGLIRPPKTNLNKPQRALTNRVDSLFNRPTPSHPFPLTTATLQLYTHTTTRTILHPYHHTPLSPITLYTP